MSVFYRFVAPSCRCRCCRTNTCRPCSKRCAAASASTRTCYSPWPLICETRGSRAQCSPLPTGRSSARPSGPTTTWRGGTTASTPGPRGVRQWCQPLKNAPDAKCKPFNKIALNDFFVHCIKGRSLTSNIVGCRRPRLGEHISATS